MTDEINKIANRVCVTGAAGYIGSWLIKNLLERGYTVNATLRDPGDKKKSEPLLKLPGAEERLKLFKSDLYLEGSFDSAVEGCHGVFHLATPMDFTKSNLDDFVVPAVNGVHNFMRACVRAKSVRRIVFTSSVMAASPRNGNGELTQTCLDEMCWSPVSFCKSQTNKSAWYVVAKTLAEQEALKYGVNYNIEVVSILPAVVIGPWFTTAPAVTPAQTLLALIAGSNEYYELMKFAEFMLGSISIVHIDDTCNAHIFLMEHPDAQNRYVCASESPSIKDLKDFLSKHYSEINNSIKVDEDDEAPVYLAASSKKLMEMGFAYKYQLHESLQETIECVIKNGVLKL